MSVEQPGVVDIIGTSGTSVILTISDHLDWTDETGHVLALQEKLNTYLSFIESGELLEVYPHALGRSRIVEIAMRVPPSPVGNEFLEQVRPILMSAGCELRIRVTTEGGG